MTTAAWLEHTIDQADPAIGRRHHRGPVPPSALVLEHAVSAAVAPPR